ncbi:MAG: 5'-3' exonuclease [Actinotalea sp.]|nr:5'-3' exonuclease [Actinotalea sp.]
MPAPAAARPLLLLDTASLYFRAFFGVPDSVKAPDGTPVNAVRGLLDMIATLVSTRRPDGLVACWDDDWRPAFRVEAIPTYKEHRLAADGAEEVPEALTAQIPVIVEVLEAFGIARVGAPGYEADDVIGTLTAREVARPGGERRPVEVVTGDRDLFQLVDDDAPVRVLYTARGIRDLDIVDQARLAERYDVPDGAAYADLATLRGDSSDGLPGVGGIGEKTAATLLHRYGSLDGILRALEEGDPGLTAAQRRRLTEGLDYLAVAPAVVRVAPDAPVADTDDALPATPADHERLVALAQQWGLTSSVTRLVDALAKV